MAGRRDNTEPGQRVLTERRPVPMPAPDAGFDRLNLPRPGVMGILNITPDSFSDGGQFLHPDRAVERALEMIEQGAAIIDTGGESTRPGAEAVSVQQEADRVLPVIETLAGATKTPISIDTSKPAVMRMAVSAGAAMINDVRALREPGALPACAELNVPVCLMHMQGRPRTMQQSPAYPDGIINEINAFFSDRIEQATKAGIAHHNICLDPGFGFGKTLRHNYQLLNGLPSLLQHKAPIMVGISRKSMIGRLLNLPVQQRLPGSLSAAVIAVMQGADIIRTHDVKSTLEALQIIHAMRRAHDPQGWQQ